MALFYPALSEIFNNRREPPTSGEREMLVFLSENLDDSFEIYFQPYLNILHPDIIIVKRGCGVFIIEVKDWNLSVYNNVSYEINGYEYIGCNEGHHSSPTAQVDSYAYELANLCSAYKIGNIIENKTTVGNKKYGISDTIFKAVYFHSEYRNDNIKRLFELDNYSRCKDKSYAYIWQNCNVNSKFIISRIEHDLNPQWTKNYFNDKAYHEVSALLQPSIEQAFQSEPFVLNKKQLLLSESTAKTQAKIAGVAGSGKTLVLAQRAVNAYNRTGNRVLIITYNITLINYIHDKIAQIYHGMNINASPMKTNYLVINFHNLLKSTAQSIFPYCNITAQQYNNIDEWVHNTALYIKNNIQYVEKYDAVFVDEVQDIKKEWLDIIKNLYLKKDGEFVIFADEKQDIYNNTVKESEEAHKPKTNIPGRWSKLEKSYRMYPTISRVVSDFALEFFDETYENRDMSSDLIELPGEKIFRYFDLRGMKFDPALVCRIINTFRSEISKPISPNDIVILSYDHEHIRYLEEAFNNVGVVTATVSETVEEYKAVEKKYRTENENVNADDIVDNCLKMIRRMRKSNFYMNRGCIKISTIESFKGWEIDTVFILLDSGNIRDYEEKRIYTAISRARTNLVIIDYGIKKEFSEFFSNENNCIVNNEHNEHVMDKINSIIR